MRKTYNSARVVVLGAGPSGIAAATKLLEAGFTNVIILEAENRVGGRIHTIPFADNVIDLGAQWCHGERHNAVYETLREKRKYNLLDSTGSVYDDYKCIRSNKEILDESQAVQFKNIAFNSILQRQTDLISYQGSLGDYTRAQYWKAVNKLPGKVDKVLAEEFLKNFEKIECSIEGADTLYVVSAKGHLDYWQCEGDLLLNWKDKGFQCFLDILMNAEPDNPLGILGRRVLLNHRVQNIDWSVPEAVKIKCFNGVVVIADHVICTCSLGVLKSCHASMFRPALPFAKVKAIEGLTLGTVDKFFIEFKEPFGPADWTGMCFLWLEEDLKELRKTDHFWLQGVFGFYRVSYQPRVLEGWIIGAEARYMELLPEEKVRDSIMWLFRKFLKFEVPEPINFKRTQWFKNKNFRGSYSFRSLWVEELCIGACDLATPIMSPDAIPILQFAGESTHSHYYSTVHGAVESGWREAQRLIDLYKDIPAHL